jgi:hypothetical protein
MHIWKVPCELSKQGRREVIDIGEGGGGDRGVLVF